MFSFRQEILLGKTQVGPGHRPYLIAEIGLNHNRDIELGKRIIAAAAASGANAVKFQSYTSEKFIHPGIPKVRFLYDIFKNLELSWHDHQALSKCALAEGVDFFSTPLSNDWVKKLADLGVPCFKIASGDVNNFSLLAEVVQHTIPVIVSTGAASFGEIKLAADFMLSKEKTDVIFMHCVSLYPAKPGQLNLATIAKLKHELTCITGFSDHSEGAEAALAAIAAGACLLEKHFTLDHSLPGPDQKLSATPDILAAVRKNMDLAYAMGGTEKVLALPEEVLGDEFGKRSLYQINGETVALRPRDAALPKDSEFFQK